MVGVRADRLQLADAVVRIEPGESVRGERSVRRFHHAIEIEPIRPGGLEVDEALDRDARRRPDHLVQLDPRSRSSGLDRAKAVSLRDGWLETVGQLACVVDELLGVRIHLVAAAAQEGEPLRVGGERRDAQLFAFHHLLEPRNELFVQRAATMPRMDLVLQRRWPSHPGPSDGLGVLLPEPNPPLAFASRVLEPLPRDVADVVLDLRSLEAPELADERLHPARLRKRVSHSASRA